MRILDRLTLAFDRPGIYCVIGPNGAGKTSTFNMLTGELPAQAGRVSFDGRSIDRLPTHRIVRLGIGRKFQIPSVFADLTIADNLAIALWSGRAGALALAAAAPAPLVERAARRARAALSVPRRRRSHRGRSSRTASARCSSWRWRCSASRACCSSTSRAPGLSPQETAAAIDAIRWASERRGATIVVIEHDMSLVRKLADHVFVLHNGSLIAEGSVAQVQGNAAVQAIYVGAEK